MKKFRGVGVSGPPPPSQSLAGVSSSILKTLAEHHGYARLAVFGSVAPHQARPDSSIDLIVEAPESTSSIGLVRIRQLLEQALGREIDLIDYGGLKLRLDGDIRSEVVAL